MKLTFSVDSILLDALVLAIAAKEDVYGYQLSQKLQIAGGFSDTALYPVLRRLMKDQCLDSYELDYHGRARRYYRTTAKGISQLGLYRREWTQFKKNIDGIMGTERV